MSIANIHQVFHRADAGGKGYLTRDDFLVALVGLLGYEPSRWEVQYTCKGIDIDGCKMTLPTFSSLLKAKLAAVADQDAAIRHAFLATDVGCRGYITPDNLRKVFRTVAPAVTSTIIDEAFFLVDKSGSGRITYREFENIMKA
ncbi:EF-hand calcium-binding domain-containing protein 11 [Geranomyces michiganensis]|nr:EF-hand calcium-binding domain-containing protein 11 [Geranomyces michiganensis]